MPANLNILWYKQTLVSIVINDVPIYIDKSLGTIDDENLCLELDFMIPLIEASKLAAYIVNGISVINILGVIKILEARIQELKVLEQRNKELDLDINLGGW